MRLINIGQSVSIKHAVVLAAYNLLVHKFEHAVFRNRDRIPQRILGREDSIIGIIVADKHDLISGVHLRISFTNHAGLLDAARAKHRILAGLLVKFNDQVYTLAIEQGIRLNILSADTRSIGEKTFGNMVLGLPEDETEAARALLYLRELSGVSAEEVTGYV
jgi:hypothetical protein